MECPADAVSAIRLHNRRALTLGQRLDDLANLCIRHTWPTDCDRRVKAFTCCLDQMHTRLIRLSLGPYRIGRIQVPMEAAVV